MNVDVLKNDPAFLVAKGSFRSGNKQERYEAERSHRLKLGNAIYMAMINHGNAVIRAIGSSAIANAVRAITIAGAKCKLNGIDIVWDSCFDTGSLQPLNNEAETVNVTAILFRLRGFNEIEGE